MTPWEIMFVEPILIRLFEILLTWQDAAQVSQMLDEGCPND